MGKTTRIYFFLLRLALGWYFLYAGVSKILNPEWSAAGYLGSAKTLAPLYIWFASPANIGWINIVNEWGLALIGLLLILGLWVRYASIVGIAFMILYYFPALSFPYAGEHAYLIDNHVIFLLVFLLFIVARAGNYFGLDGYLKK